PQHGATGVLTDRMPIYVDFSHDMNPSTISTTNIQLYQAGVTAITTHSVTYSSLTRQAEISLAGDWPTSQSIRVVVGTGCTTAYGYPLAASKEATFTTGAVGSLPDSD